MKIFLSCGIGDFFGIVSFMTQEEKLSVTEIYWGTRQHNTLRQFIPIFFPNAINQIVLWDKFTLSEDLNKNPTNINLVRNFCVHSLDDLYKRFPITQAFDRRQIVDYSVQPIAGDAVRGVRKYYGIPELKNRTIADVQHLPLPEKFVFIHPWSDNQRYPERDLSTQECSSITEYLDRNNLTGIVINKSINRFPITSPRILDWTNKTNFIESVELLRRAYGFIGSASSFSVLASKLLSNDFLFIKAPISIVDKWWKFYYAPYKENQICYTSLMALKGFK